LRACFSPGTPSPALHDGSSLSALARSAFRSGNCPGDRKLLAERLTDFMNDVLIRLRPRTNVAQSA